MRIALFVGEYPGYSTTFIFGQMEALLRRGHSIEVYAERRPAVQSDAAPAGVAALHYEDMPAGAWGRLKGLAARGRMPWHTLNPLRFGHDALSLRLAWPATVWPRGRFDVILCHFGAHGRKAVLLREAGAIEGKIVTAMHGDDITRYPRLFAYPIYAPLFARGDWFLPVSEFGRRELIRLGCPAERVEVHRMGVDTSLFCPVARAAGRLRVLTVARLTPCKGIAETLEALARVSFDFEYQVIGEGPLRAGLEAQARRLGLAARVVFSGMAGRAEVLQAMQAAHVFVLASRMQPDGEAEGIPVALMEAMACELPVVSTVHCGIPELVEDGVSGLLTPEGDIEALAAALERVAGSVELRVAWGAAGRRKVMGEFEAEVWNRRLEEVLERVVSL